MTEYANNIIIMGVSEGEVEKEKERLFKEIVAENFPNLGGKWTFKFA